MKSIFQPDRLFKLIMWGLALLVAYFLTHLGALVVQDLPKSQQEISLEDYHSSEVLAFKKQTKALEKRLASLSDQKDIQQLKYEAAQSKYTSEKSKFDNWVSTRKVTEDDAHNLQLNSRVQLLDSLEQDSQKELQSMQSIDQEVLAAQQALKAVAKSSQNPYKSSLKKFEKAQFKQTLKIFLMRLAIILPLLLLAAWLFVRKRHSKYWPFVWGYIFFALNAFFFELAPYLPSYGGYVRSLVGLVMVVTGGYYGIQWMQNFLAERQRKETLAENERRKYLNAELAIKKVDTKVCPSCERGLHEEGGKLNNFCVYCGLTIFTQCRQCNTRHNVFFQYCPECGVDKEEEKAIS